MGGAVVAAPIISDQHPNWYNLNPEPRNWDLSTENYFMQSNDWETFYFRERPKNELYKETFGVAYIRAEDLWLKGANQVRFMIDFYFPEFFAFVIFCTFLFWFSFRGRFQGVFANKYSDRLGNIVASVISVNNLMWVYLI